MNRTVEAYSFFPSMAVEARAYSFMYRRDYNGWEPFWLVVLGMMGPFSTGYLAVCNDFGDLVPVALEYGPRVPKTDW